MDYFAKNLNAIKERYPELFKRLKRMKPPKDVKIVRTPSGHPTAKWRVNGKWQYIHDQNDPRKASDRFVFEEKKMTNPRLVVFLGFGLGYNIFSFLERRPSVNQYIIIIEKELKIVWMAFHKFDLTPMLMREEVFCLFDIDMDDLFLKFMAVLEKGGMVRFAKAFEFIETPVLYLVCKSYYKNVIKIFNTAIRETLNNIGNDPKDSFIGLDNTLINHRFFIEAPGINQLYDKFTNIPAIIVATGPSLNKNIEQLKGCEQKALIISVDASLKPLLKHGITPHLVTSLERVPLVKKFFTRIPADKLKNTWLVAIPLLTRDSLTAYKGEKIVALRAFAHYYWLGIEKGILPIGPSAANMAFSVAEALGCNPIILVGQDLAYAADGRTHAADNALGEIQEEILPEKIETRWVKGNNEDKVLTTIVWYMFLKNFENLISKYRGTCINATEGGAYIPGTELMTLYDVRKKYLGNMIDVPSFVRKFLKNPSEKEITDLYSRLAEVLSKGITDLTAYIKECREWEQKIRNYLDIELQDEENLGKLYNKNVSFIKKINKVKVNISNRNSYKGVMHHILQSFIVGEEIVLNAVPVYNNPDPVNAQRGIIAEHINWFKTNYELMEKTRHILKRHLSRIRKAGYLLKGENK